MVAKSAVPDRSILRQGKSRSIPRVLQWILLCAELRDMLYLVYVIIDQQKTIQFWEVARQWLDGVPVLSTRFLVFLTGLHRVKSAQHQTFQGKQRGAFTCSCFQQFPDLCHCPAWGWGVDPKVECTLQIPISRSHLLQIGRCSVRDLPWRLVQNASLDSCLILQPIVAHLQH